MNRVFISGRLTKDVEKKTSANGTEYVKNSVAVDKYLGKDKGKKTLFIDIMAFAHSANFLNAYCKKGTMVHIEGELDNSIVEREDGSKATYWTVFVNSVEAEKPKTEEPKTEETATPFVEQEEDSALPFEV